MLLALPIMLAAAFLLPVLNENQSLFVILNKSVNVIGTPLLAVMICVVFRFRWSAQSVFWGALLGFFGTIALSATVRALALHGYAVLSLALTLGLMALIELFRRVWQSRSI